MEVARITTGKAHAAHVIEPLHIVEVSIDMVAEAEVVLCRVTHHAVLDLVILYIAPRYGHLTHVHYLQEPFLLAARTGHAEGCLHVTLKAQTLGDTIGCYSQATINLGRKFPSEH